MKFKKFFSNYLNSFKGIKKLYLKILLIDFLAILFFVGLTLAANFLMLGMISDLNIDSAEDINLLLSTYSGEELEQFSIMLYKFAAISLFVMSVALIASLLVFAYSRKLIWKELNKKEHHKYWRWAILSISILIIGFLFLIISALIASLVQQIFSLFNWIQIGAFASSLILLLLTMLIMNVAFAIKHEFAHVGKVWEAIGKGFALIKTKFKKVLPIIFWQFLTLIVANLVIVSIFRYLLKVNSTVIAIVQLIIFLLFISWARIYFYKTVKE